MVEEFLENYFTTVAAKVKSIDHTEENPAYYRIEDKYDLAEFDNAARNLKGRCCLLLEMGSGSFTGWDSPRDDARIGLHLLIKTDGKLTSKKAARSEAKEILISIIALIRKDCEDLGLYADDQEGPLKTLNTIFDSAGKYDDMAVAEVNRFGKSIYFDMKAPVDMSYNAENYN